MEGPEHIALKKIARKLLNRLDAWEIVEEGEGNVDIAGKCRGVWVAFEVGNSSRAKIESLQEMYDIVVHLPYCYTPDTTWPISTLEKQLDHKIIAFKCEAS